MKKRIISLIVVLLLILSMVLSACGPVKNPGGVNPTPTKTPTPTSSGGPTTPDLSVDEELLASYFGIYFPDITAREANLVPQSQTVNEKTEYDFGDNEFLVTLDTSASIFSDYRVSITASIKAFDPSGAPLNQGITNGGSVPVNFGHSLKVKYPGSYYVTYKVQVDAFESGNGLIDLDSIKQEYTIEKTYKINKVKANIYAESDFYFIGDYPYFDEINYYIITDDGINIKESTSADILKTSNVTLVVPTVETPLDREHVYSLKVVGKSFGNTVVQSDIKARFYDITFHDGARYVIPKEDEQIIRSLYGIMPGKDVQESLMYYDRVGDLSVALDRYKAMTVGQQFLFEFYPEYIKGKPGDQTDFAYKRDSLFIYQYNERRIAEAELLRELVASEKTTIFQVEVLRQQIVDHIIKQNHNPVYVKEVLSYKDSDVAFISKYVFGESNGLVALNKFVELEKVKNENGAYQFTNNNSKLVNEQVNLKIDMVSIYVHAIDALSSALRHQPNQTAVVRFNELIKKVPTSENLQQIAVQIKKVEDANFITRTEYFIEPEIIFAIESAKVELDKAYKNLFAYQRTNEMNGLFAVKTKDANNMIIRYNAFYNVIHEYDLSRYVTGDANETFTQVEALLGYDFSRLAGTSKRVATDLFESQTSSTMGYMIMNEPIIFISILENHFRLWLGNLLAMQKDFDDNLEKLINTALSSYGTDFYEAISKKYDTAEAGYNSKGFYSTLTPVYESKLEFYMFEYQREFHNIYPWHKVTQQDYSNFTEQAFSSADRFVNDYMRTDNEYLQAQIDAGRPQNFEGQKESA